MIRRWFFLWGAEDDDDAGTDDDDTGASGSSDDDTTRTITTKELEQMTARAADKATRKAKRELATSMGFDNMADLNEFVTTTKQATDDAQDEQTKVLQAAERSQKEYEAKVSALADQSLKLTISQQVVGAGIGDPKRASRITALVLDDLDPDILEDEESWSGAVADALQSVKDDMPELFAKPGVGSGDGGAHGDSSDDDDGAEQEKQLVGHFQKKGMIEYPS